MNYVCITSKTPEVKREKILKIANSYLICDSSAFHQSTSFKKIVLNRTELPLTKSVNVSGEFHQFYVSGQHQFCNVSMFFINNDLCYKSINCKISCFELSNRNDETRCLLTEVMTEFTIEAKCTKTIPLVNTTNNSRCFGKEIQRMMFQIEERRLVEDVEEPLNPLIQSFSRTFDDNTFKDVKFVVGEESLLAHKFVLAARSDVFYAMFVHDTKERKEGVIEMQDVGMAALKSFVKYLYTDQVYNIEEEVEELLMLADKYNVPSLQDKCQEYMSLNNSINESNAVSYLIKAHKYNSKLLKKLALLSIRYYISKILQTDDLDSLDPYPSLMKDIISLLGDKDVNSSAKRLGLER